MPRSSTRHVNMNKENTIAAKVEEPTSRITRAKAKALGTSGGIFPSSKPTFKPDHKCFLRVNSKRAASDENKASVTATSGIQHKRRAVLKDVTNICENLERNCRNFAKIQTSKQASISPPKKIAKVASDVSVETLHVEEDVKAKLAEELSKIRMVEPKEVTESTSECGEAERNHPTHVSEKAFGLQDPQMRAYLLKDIASLYYMEELCIQCLLKDYATDIVHCELDLFTLIELLLYFIMWLMFGRRKQVVPRTAIKWAKHCEY